MARGIEGRDVFLDETDRGRSPMERYLSPVCVRALPEVSLSTIVPGISTVRDRGACVWWFDRSTCLNAALTMPGRLKLYDVIRRVIEGLMGIAHDD